MIDEKILKLCMKVNGMKTYYPQYESVGGIPLEPTPDMIGKYGWNKNVVAFVTPDGSYYVTPYCVEVIDYLSNHGYKNDYITVPFSNGDEPSDSIVRYEWKKLCFEAKEVHNLKEKERRKQEISNISRSKGIKKLPKEIYEMSLEIPDNGIAVMHYFNMAAMVYPIPKFNLRDFIGAYAQKNSKLIFIDDNGKTYVTPYCHEVRELLNNCGYCEGKMQVPLADGEEIIDSNVSKVWGKLCMGAKVSSNLRKEANKIPHMQEVAKRKGILPLPIDAYKLTFEIPEKGIETLWYGEQVALTLPVDEWNVENALGTYTQNCDRLVFVNDLGKTYVTPFCSEIRGLLSKCGYREGSLEVPFSNGEIPVNDVDTLKWKQLCGLALKAIEQRDNERRINKISKLAKAKGITTLPYTVYSLSLKIPKEGFDTVFFDTDVDLTRPVRDWELEKVLGTYCQYNGRVAFVDDKGETFVTPHCDEVTTILEEHGYVPGKLCVPLSNGEKIINEDIRKKWEELCSRLPEVASRPKL